MAIHFYGVLGACTPHGFVIYNMKTGIERRRFHAAIQVYRVLHKLSPSYLHDTFHYAVNITSHTGRNLYRLFVPRVRTTLAKHSFYFRGTQIWNSLNPILYAIRKLEQFKLVYQSLY